MTNVDNTFEGSGGIGDGTTFMRNEGLILANGSDLLSAGQCDGTFTNVGELRAASGSGGMSIGAPTMDQSGSVILESGSGLVRFGDYVQNAGSTSIEGTLYLWITGDSVHYIQNGGHTELLGEIVVLPGGSATVILNDGTFSGTGSVDGTVEADAASTARVEPGAPTGTLHVSNLQMNGGTLAIQVAGWNAGEFSAVEVVGTATIKGTLEISHASGYPQGLHGTVRVVQADSVDFDATVDYVDEVTNFPVNVVVGPNYVDLVWIATTPAPELSAGAPSLDRPLVVRPDPAPGGRASVAFEVPANTTRCDLSVFDLSGRLVLTLASGSLGAGTRSVTWDGRTAGGVPVASGVYFVRLDTRLAHRHLISG